MNKKVFILPLAVIATGLASCNQGWPTLSEEDAISRAAAVAEYQKTLADLNSSIKTVSNILKGKTGGKESSSESHTTESVDVSKKYYKYYSIDKETVDGKTTETILTIRLLTKDGKYYELEDEIIDGQQTKKSKKTYADETTFMKSFEDAAEDIYKATEINADFEEQTYIDLNNLNASILAYKAIQEEIKDKTDQHYNYAFLSNADHNFCFKIDKKLNFEDYGVLETDVEEHIIENGFYTSYNCQSCVKKDDNNYEEANYTYKLTPNAAVSIDNVNPDEYTEE